MTTVLALGCFDILHIGHLRHLRAARELGDWLIVALTLDEFVNKGHGRPVFDQDQRAEMLRALEPVDHVIFVNGAEQAIRVVRPQIYVKGCEYEGRLPEQSLVESFGGRVVFTDEIVFSSTALVPYMTA